ncbi:MAG TPA: hypothetical protein VGK67_05460 [Myxococcales bacterium]|jgi:hypothetical protein
MRAFLRVAAKALIGAAGGAVAMIAVGQLVALYTETCYVVCQPAVAAQLGALSGAVAVFTIQPYKPG